MKQENTISVISVRRFLLPGLLMIVLVCWWWDRSLLQTEVHQSQAETVRLSSQMTGLKRTAVQKFLHAKDPPDRSIDIKLWKRLSDAVYSKPPQNQNAQILWDQVSQELPMKELHVYHVHFPDWDDDPNRLSPRDYHFFVRENEVVALGIEQGVVGQINPKPWSTVFDL